MQATPFPSTMTMAVPMSAMQPMPYGFHQQQVLVLMLITKTLRIKPLVTLQLQNPT